MRIIYNSSLHVYVTSLHVYVTRKISRKPFWLEISPFLCNFGRKPIFIFHNFTIVIMDYPGA